MIDSRSPSNFTLRSVEMRFISRHLKALSRFQQGDSFQANFPSKSESHRRLEEIESTAGIGILVARFVEKK